MENKTFLRGLQEESSATQLLTIPKKEILQRKRTPLTMWSYSGSLKWHSFCHQQFNSNRPLAVTLLPAGSQLGYQQSLGMLKAGVQKEIVSEPQKCLSEGTTWAALLHRQKDEGCPHKPDARPCNTVVAFSQVFQTAAFTQLGKGQTSLKANRKISGNTPCTYSEKP